MKSIMIWASLLVLTAANCVSQTQPASPSLAINSSTTSSIPTSSPAATGMQTLALTRTFPATETPSYAPITPARTLPPTGLTARQGYPLAQQTAMEWRPDSVLDSISGTILPLDQMGHATSWTYNFVIANPKNQGELTQVFQVTVDQDGVKNSAVVPGQAGFPMANIEDWVIDSQEAIQIAIATGGNASLQLRPNAPVKAALRLSRPGGLVSNPATKMVLWEITYGSSDEYRTISVDGTTGAVLTMVTVWDENRQLPSITAMDGYSVAKAKAEEWNPDAVLLKIDTSSVCIPHQTSLSQEGKSPVWTYWFAIDNPSNAEESTRSFSAAVCGGELAGFEEGYPGEIHKVQGTEEDWIIDSPEIVEIAEQNGGEQARARNLSTIIAILFLDKPTNAPAAPKNVTWVISYQDLSTYPVEVFSVFIDGTTGQLIGTQ